ncbi:hypothetical protein N7467_012050 [Penicillium canescens]|nr:hypothetical protein N7467_012050 [Penicillium canescens]
MAVTLSDLTISDVSGMIAVGIAIGCEELTLNTSSNPHSNRIAYNSTWVLKILAAHVICSYLVSLGKAY